MSIVAHKRVVVLLNFIPPYRLPIFRKLSQIFPNLVFMISTDSEPNRDWDVEHDGLRVIVQKTLTVKRIRRHPVGFKDTRYVHFPFDTLPLLFRHKPDVIISGELGARTLQACLYRRLRPNTKLLVWGTLSEVTERGLDPARQMARKLISRCGDRFIVNGESGKRYFKGLGVSDSQIDKIPQCCDLEKFAGPGTRDPSVASRILVIGNLSQLKGVLPFLELVGSWAKLRPTRSVDILVVGSGSEEVRAMDLAQRLPPSVKIEFRSPVPYDAVPSLYRECGILAFPTLADEWGLVVNEAVCAGLPVLGSCHSQAVEELVTDNVNGWLFRPIDKEGMLGALDRALRASPNELDRMREAGQLRISDFAPDNIVSMFVAAIEKACSSNGE